MNQEQQKRAKQLEDAFHVAFGDGYRAGRKVGYQRGSFAGFMWGIVVGAVATALAWWGLS